MKLFSTIVLRATWRLRAQDAEDFAQSAQLWLIERNYDVFDQFAGRSALSTYLTMVVNRLLIDWQNAQYGRWRPSAAARRLGDEAVTLERLIYRDRFVVSEALTRMQHVHSLSRQQSLAILEQLPVRHPRTILSDDALQDLAAPGTHDLLEDAERRRAERRREGAVRAGLRQLSREDRWLLRARYHEGRTVRAVAQTLKLDPKRLYRRYERILDRLRGSIQAVVQLESRP